jgi:mannosyl-oligosaccharide alpha-1,2-mannosidase
MRLFRRSSVAVSKIACAAFILIFYFFYSKLNPPALTKGQPLPKRPSIQYDNWQNNSGKADEIKKQRIKDAMEHTYAGYRQQAWGFDDIKPISGGVKNTRNGWGAFIVDSSSTLAVMGLWDNLLLEINYIINEIDFTKSNATVDPFETTIRYLGGLVSLVELADAGIIPKTVMTDARREGIIRKAADLADNLLLAFDVRTGLPWPRIQFGSGKIIAGSGSSIGPARAGSNFLEFCTLTKLTGDHEYCSKATRAWSVLVWNKHYEAVPGLVDSKIGVTTGDPVGKERHWDGGHDSYYEYLIKASLLLPDSPNSKVYAERWMQAANAIQANLTTRSAPSEEHLMSHLFMGKYNDKYYLNEMSHLACFAPGNLIYGGRHLQQPDLVTLGKAILEACRATYQASPTGLGPERWSWEPAAGSKDRWSHHANTLGHKEQFKKHGIWVTDARYKLRPEYFESLYYAYRATGEQRYRDWGWEGFEALEKTCKTNYGYAEIKDVMAADGSVILDDFAESFFAGETLKYLYLLFDDVNAFSLDDWIFTTEAHPLKRVR